MKVGCWKKLLWISIASVFLAACAPKRVETQFSKNKKAEAGQTYTEAQLRAAIGSERYDTLVMGIGADNLNLLTYGIGISNMAQFLNNITLPGKLPALLSDGPHSRKLNSTEVLILLNKLDDACHMPGSFGNDTIMKMTNMINMVTPAGMEGIKNIVHGVSDTTAMSPPYSDPNGVNFNNGISRLALMMSLLDESMSVMPTLINDLAAPSGSFSAEGTSKLIRLVNGSHDLRDVAAIINGTTNISNITQVMLGLEGNIYCDKPEYPSKTTCQSNGGTWVKSLCSNINYSTRASCETAGAVWTPDGIENMTRIINELDRICSNASYTDGTSCLNAGGTWHTKASKIPIIVNNITAVPNMYNIVNGLTNDNRRPPWPSGLPAAYPGDVGNIFDGVDSMVATLNAINASSMGDPATSNNIPFGLNGVKRLAYMVNQLDTTPVFENDSDFEGGVNCANGQFDNRLNWAFTDNGPAGAPWFDKSWASTSSQKQGGACSLASNDAASTIYTATQSAELLVNLTTAGNMTVYTKTDALGNFDILRIFVNDTMVQSWTKATGGAGFQPRTVAITTGLKRIRFDVQRIPGSTGQAFIDTMVLPGTKGASRTAAEKTAILMNNLYINSSLTNVAEILNNATAPACVSTPLTCTPTNNNGLDGLIYAANRSEYPGGISGGSLISNGSPATVTWTSHNLAQGTAVKFQTSGTLPTPLSPNTIYYVRNPTANTFNLSTTPSGVLVNTSSAGSGAHLTIALPRLAVTVNGIANLNEMYGVLNNLTSLTAYQQLVAMMDFADIPKNVPDLINGLGAGGGAKTASILMGLTAAGTSNMLRTLAEPASDGAAISDVSDLINGATTTGHVAVALSELSLSGNVFLGKSNASGITIGSPAVVTWTNHGFREQTPIYIDTSGSLPTGLAAGRTYYMKNVDTNTFELSAAPGGASINTTGSQSGTHTIYAKGEYFFDTPTGGPSGGRKFAQFFSAVNTKSTATSQNCAGAPGSMNSNFCVKFHFVRIVNDLAASSGGPLAIARVVTNLRPDAGPGGNNGITRMTEALFDVRTMGTPTYRDRDPGSVGALSNATNDPFGRMTTLIADMNVNGPINMARMVNELDFSHLVSRGTWLIKNTNRIRYFSRTMSEMTSADLMLRLLDHPSMPPTRINTLVNTHGDETYGVGAVGSYGGAIYGQSPSGTGCTASDCDTNTTDKLGRMIQMINNITQIPNTVYMMTVVQDMGYVSYLIDNLTRIHYMTDIVNNLTNVDLMVKTINGADGCSVYKVGVNDTIATDTTGNCTAAGGTWFGVGRCINFPTQQTRASCQAAGSGTGIWHGAVKEKMNSLLNGLGTSTVKGTGSKNVGDMFTLYDVVNRLGYNGSTPRSPGQQVRVVRLMNGVEQCGLREAYDKYIQYPPTCVDASGNPRPLNFQFRESCDDAGAGYNWQSKASTTAWVSPSTIYYDCGTVAADGTVAQGYTPPTPTLSGGGYYNTGDAADYRPRLLQAMLNVNDGVAFSYITGDVQDTAKTINMMNSVRRVNAVTTLVNLMPGPVTAALINDTDPAAVTRSLVYMANNLDDDETETAKAFASMIHFGTRIEAQGRELEPYSCSCWWCGCSTCYREYTPAVPTCLEFSAIGPRRMAAVLNLEAGPYLEGLLAGLGWQMSIAAMNCGWSRDADENTGSCGTTSWSDGSSGGLYKAVGRSYNGNPKPAGPYCVRPREITDGYKYGNYTWSGGAQGIRYENCVSTMPWMSGGNAVITVQDETDKIIWNGLSSIAGDIDDGLGSNGCTGATCSDMWSILKGQGSGIVGWVMTLSSSWVGFPPPRNFGGMANGRPDGSSAGTLCSGNGNDGNNWQCIRCGLADGDLSSNATGSCTSTSNGRYWGNWCSGAGTSGSRGTNAKNCVYNGGTWKATKNYQAASCKLDPTVDGRIAP